MATDQEIITGRDFNSISPSAKSLIFLKGNTNIPFARQTEELLAKPDKYFPDHDNRDMNLWARILHFENRYQSINKLTEDLEISNILELSSGYSFRCLEISSKKNIHYIDTDLPEVIETKKKIVRELQSNNPQPEGQMDMFPLNVLDRDQFDEVVSHFSEGKILILNEGLLMYLDMEEKEKLCKTIHRVLKERGGYWITADIYIKKRQQKFDLKIDERTKDFFLKHNIEKNKFESFDEAENFFNRMGFGVDRRADVMHSKLSSLRYFLRSVTLKQLFKIRKSDKMQETWRLMVSE